MEVKLFKEALADVPDDYKLNLRKMMAIDTSEQFKDLPPGYNIALDLPIIGIAMDEQSKEVVFVIGGKGAEELCWLLEFGKVTKIER